MTQVLTVSSQKGGVGKSTLVVQLAVCLHNQQKKVCVIDCDSDQGTVTRYLGNRERGNLPTPYHTTETNDVIAKVNEVAQYHDFVIIDTPGGKSPLAEAAHRLSNTIITVFNDSFADLDVLVRVDKADSRNITSREYSSHVWNERKLRLQEGRHPQDWLLVLNRVGQATKNRRQVMQLIERVSAQWGVQFAGVIKERVGYRNGFLAGRTPLDPQPDSLTVSHVSARQEIRRLVSLVRGPRAQGN